MELAIALSIIYAAAMAVLRPVEQPGDNLRAVAITSAIGLLHGFGFSFMLHQILQVDAPNFWQNLLAFNIGVELGQLAIVLLIWPLVIACVPCRTVYGLVPGQPLHFSLHRSPFSGPFRERMPCCRASQSILIWDNQPKAVS